MWKQLLAGVGITVGCSTFGHAQEVDPAYKEHGLLGVESAEAKLHRFSFKDNSHKMVGVIKDKNGKVFKNINATSYIAGHMNLFAYWTDPLDGLCKLVYVNAVTAEGVIVGQDLGTGYAGDAVAAQMEGYGLDNKRWVNFVTLQAKTVATSNLKVAGAININPNNSPHNEFNMTKTGGAVVTRDDLKSSAVVTANGTFYQGGATRVLVKPKGNGNQNSLTINGQVFPVNNNTTYEFKGDMTVRVWNDHIHNGKAMGHWWIDISANGTVEVNGQLQAASNDVHRLVRVDHRNGSIEHSMTLARMYEGLATLDGVTFYACTETKLYKINVSTETETLVGNLPGSKFRALEFVGSTLMAFDSTSDTMIPIRTSDAAQIVNGATLGPITDLGAKNYFPLADAPEFKLSSYD